MPFRPPPTPNSERAALTERLMREGSTDTARWAQAQNLATQWDARAALAATWIAPGSRVLDIGCGAMALEALLPPGCSYQPADVVARRAGCMVVDLNRGDFPEGAYDCVTFLGVLEYVHDPLAALRRAAVAAPRMIVTYCTYTGGDVQVRRGMGWVNDYTSAQFQEMLGESGWTLERTQEVKRGPSNVQVMFGCSRT